ncbi:MAG: hypothetical protein L3J16_05710 [Anaerolineales bacterium]|nr:hypothetical protein [Anaerolineales bacterium]
MNTMQWEVLTEVFDRLEAEMMKAALEALAIDVELSQESVGATIPVNFGSFGRVQIFVPKEKMTEAQAWLKEYEASPRSGKADTDDSDLNYIEIQKP